MTALAVLLRVHRRPAARELSGASRGIGRFLLTLLVVVGVGASICSAWTTSSSFRNQYVRNPLDQRCRPEGRRTTLSAGNPRFYSALSAVELKSSSSEVNASAEVPRDNIDNNEEDEEDGDEYEYVEYDSLTEQEFIGSEWLVGTNWDRNPNKIDETWARLVVDKDGKNVVVWGDQSQGVWTLDVASQFLSLSKENIVAGKEIWACTVTDYYYLQGTVRAWKYWSAAAVIGQWQAKRLGVDPDEAGTPPWMENDQPPQN